MASPSEMRVIAERIPNARLMVIEQANHLVPSEKPHEVAEAMGSFLNGLSLDR
jgi:pimeloyl-ACP methyl ester carboxylesterase